MIKDRKVEFGSTDFLEIWKLAYRKGYEYGFADRRDYSYHPESYERPPGILKKIFESYLPEQEEEE